MKYLIEQSDDMVAISSNGEMMKSYPEAKLIKKKKGVVIVENTIAKNPIDFYSNEELEKVTVDGKEL